MFKFIVLVFIGFVGVGSTAFAERIEGEYFLDRVDEGWVKVPGAEHFEQCGPYLITDKIVSPEREVLMNALWGLLAPTLAQSLGQQMYEAFRGFVPIATIEVVLDNSVSVPVFSESRYKGKVFKIRMNQNDLDLSTCLKVTSTI